MHKMKMERQSSETLGFQKPDRNTGGGGRHAERPFLRRSVHRTAPLLNEVWYVGQCGTERTSVQEGIRHAYLRSSTKNGTSRYGETCAVRSSTHQHDLREHTPLSHLSPILHVALPHWQSTVAGFGGAGQAGTVVGGVALHLPSPVESQ